jgi:hypothetical protein
LIVFLNFSLCVNIGKIVWRTNSKVFGFLLRLALHAPTIGYIRLAHQQHDNDDQQDQTRRTAANHNHAGQCWNE